MCCIYVYYNNTSTKIEVLTGYIDDGGYRFGNMCSLSFKYNKLARRFFKNYIDKEYTSDRLESDIKLVTDLYGASKIFRYKLL